MPNPIARLAPTAVDPHRTAASADAWKPEDQRARVQSGRPTDYYGRLYACRDRRARPGTAFEPWAFLHHELSESGDPGDANVTACRMGIAALNGIDNPYHRPPDGLHPRERRAIYEHLVEHLAEAKVDAPPLEELRADGRPEHRRRLPLASAETRQQAGRVHIVGVVNPFNVVSHALYGFREVSRRGAFERTAAEDDVRGLYNHDPNHLWARTTNGTLRLWESSTGLEFDGIPADTTYARDLVVLIAERFIHEMSFAFDAVAQEWHREPDYDLRELLEVKLWDISPVAFPAYPETSARPGRSSGDQAGDPDDLEDDAQARSIPAVRGLDLLIARASIGALDTEARGRLLTTIDAFRTLVAQAPSRQPAAGPAPDGGAAGQPDRRATLRRRLEVAERLTRKYGGTR